MSNDTHPYEPATPEGSSDISDLEAQTLASRLAEREDEIDYLKGLIHRLLKAQTRLRTAKDRGDSWVDALSQMLRLRSEAHDALEGHPEYDARASAEATND